MASLRYAVISLNLLFAIGCGPGIRFRPGEIPTPGQTQPIHAQAGDQTYSKMVSTYPILHDQAAERRVSRILKKLLDATPTTGHWKVTILNDQTFNAMTTPGNYIFVFRGILDPLPDGEVAAILAHEIAHRLAQHELETSEETMGKAISLIATIAAGAAVASQPGATNKDVKDIMGATHQLGSGFTTLRYSKDKEREADLIGIFLLADAGYNPQAAANVWAKQALQNGTGGSDFFSTHPLDEDRFAMAARLMPLAQERYQQALKGKRNGRKKTRAIPSPTVLLQISQAENALGQADLETASSIAQSLTRQAPSVPETYDLLGRVKMVEGEQKQALKAFKKGLSLAPNDPILTYNLACLQARDGKREQALASLEKSFTLRPSLISTAREDSDLQSLHEDPEFKALLEREYVALPPENVGGNTLSVN